MYKPKSIYTEIALQSISEYLKYKNTKNMESKEVYPELNYRKACFVSIHTGYNELRGCIGTIEPRYKNLMLEIIHNAVSAANRDPRFSALTEKELSDIHLSVDVLSEPVQIFDFENHNPEKHGLIIIEPPYKRGVLLPNLEGIDTTEEQIRIVKRKANIYKADSKLEFYQFAVNRYD